MDTASYKFDALYKKYDLFQAPSFEITMGSVVIASKHFPVGSLTIDIPSDASAGGCTFSIDSIYDYEKSAFADKIIKNLKIGKKLIIKGGYIKKEELFYGYVDRYSIDFSDSSTPRITVNGMDGMGYLMGQGGKEYAGKSTVKQVITEMLDKCKNAGFIKKITIDPNIDNTELEDVKENITDHAYLKQLAQQRFMDFLIIDGEAIFKDLTSNTKPLIELSLGNGLLSFNKSASLDKQVGSVTVRGIDKNNNPIVAKVTSTTLGGSGKTAVEQAPSFKATEQRVESLLVTTQDECKKTAQALFNRMAINHVSGTGRCIGLPEIIPGRYITISGLVKKDKNGNKEIYYISKVTHQFSTDGYYTEFEVKGAKS